MEQFPDMAEFGQDVSKYERTTQDRDWSEEDLEGMIRNGELGEEQLGILRQAEEEISQTSNFSRLLPQKNSERYYLD